MTVANKLDTSFIRFRLDEIEQSLPERFQQQVNLFAERTAIKTSQAHFTYDALDRLSNRVAQAILHNCQGQETPIGLFFGHGESMIISLLGVLKAGKIAVLMDSSYPSDRLRYIFEDSQQSLIITDSQSLDALKNLALPAQVFNLDELDNSLPDTPLNLSISPDNIACIIYTSGSTGQPKGTVYNHRILLHLVMRYTNTLEICPQDKMLLVSSSSHLAGINTIFRALMNGASVLPFDIKQRGFTDLANWLIHEHITIYNSVPTLFRQLVNSLQGDEQFPALRIILLGGELVSSRDVDLYQQHFSPGCLLINNLGCTELSGYRQYIVDRQTQVHGDILPAGYAVEGTEVILLDEAGQEVGYNCVGEIALKSSYLALGYWRKPELTAEKFQSNSDDEARIYRTGDLGRLLPDGCLIHLGRKGSQVKVNDQRFEIAEVEMALLRHQQVRQAAVIDRPYQAGHQELVAFVVLQSSSNQNGLESSISEIQASLRSRVPEYMLPSRIIFLDALPLQPNGKVDLQTLSSLVQIEQPETISNLK